MIFIELQKNSDSLMNRLFYIVASLVVILAGLALIFIIAIQTFENPVEVTLKF